MVKVKFAQRLVRSLARKRERVEERDAGMDVFIIKSGMSHAR
jgi:hypothetical protein